MLIDPLILLQAYSIGVFPMSDDRDAREVYWVEPKFRAILPLERFHQSRRQVVYAIEIEVLKHVQGDALA